MDSPPKIFKVQIALESAPQHAEALGLLLGHWAMLENLLKDMMQYLLKTDSQIAAIVYDEFISTKAKIVLMRRINHQFTSDETIKKEIEKILSTAQKLNSKRNSFIHATWASGEWSGISDCLFKVENILPHNHKQIRKPLEAVTLDQMKDVVAQIAELSASCASLLYGILLAPQEESEA